VATAARWSQLSIAKGFKHLVVDGRDAFAEWQRLVSEKSGWPIVIGGDEELESFKEQLGFDAGIETSESILRKASELRHPESLASQIGEDLEYVPEVGEWPPGPRPELGMPLLYEADGRYRSRVHIIVVPVSTGAEVPAYLHWGGWNACPKPEFHVAALRAWNSRTGAELVALNSDTMILHVTRRPESREEALDLAREQYVYCQDIVLQGTETLAPLAITLMTSDWWFFWWD
jgi:hypothetical protein